MSEDAVYQTMKNDTKSRHVIPEPGPAPIDRAVTDLDMNIDDLSSLLDDLETKIFPILGSNTVVMELKSDDGEVKASEFSQFHDRIRAQESRIVSIQDRVRNLIRRVEV